MTREYLRFYSGAGWVDPGEFGFDEYVEVKGILGYAPDA
jgi:hypothetical protein